ncbi:integrator complex assembly factor Brat1-like [Anticarsia gemmatalis]|uniref:integrator complex assembly factor Brat1-like n=1 Tax=Anticarsia gemmatalis TaxID=129554 RepID=UPI003F76AEC4
MEVNNNLEKFKLLLQYVIEGKLVINEIDAEKLLHFLDDRSENGPGKLILDSPSFSGFIYHALEYINNASIQAKVFFIEIVTILIKHGIPMQMPDMQDFPALSLKYCVLDNLNNVPPLKLHVACIKLATVHISHCPGLKIIMEQELWKHIYHPTIHHKPKQVSKAAYSFMAKLVWKLNEYNLESELMEVLGYLIEPILASDYLNVQVIDVETDKVLCDKIYAHISALLAVLSETENYVTVNRVISLLRDYYIIDQRLFDIYNATRNPCLLKLLNVCIFRYFFVALANLMFSKRTDEFCKKMAAFYRNYIVKAIQKRDAFVIIDFVIQANIFWSKFEKSHAKELNFPLTFERNGYNFEFSLQIITYLLVPLTKYAALHKFSKMKMFKMTDIIEQFMVKMGRTVTDHIYSSGYMFGMLLEEGGETLRNKVTTHTLKGLLRLRGHINATQAGPIFQSLFYLLEIFILCDGKGALVVNENLMAQDDLRMLSYLLDAMKMLLKEHDIPWYDNLEIISLQADLMNLLKHNFLTTKQVAQVLDLVDICVKKFLSPNMSLLVESKCTQDSTLNEIGGVIKLYTQHEDWEVRDSALNLLNSCTEISFIKYMPLQRVIKEHCLMILAARAGLTDPEYYAQCAALKCLAAATKIDSIWQEVLVDNPDIYSQLFFILRNDTEGMVRKEALNVLTRIYVNQKLPTSFLHALYEIMISAALDDLHWEVQLAALNFWKKAIHTHLTNRGMLDGKFPAVTFSKEKRKIIILNEKEIQRQLTGIMNDLSNIGCLTVLFQCMDDIHHVQVMEQANGIAKDLIQLLDKYDFVDPVETTKPKAIVQQKRMDEDVNVPMDLSFAKREAKRNKVLDSILNEPRSELIFNLHDNYSQMKSEAMDVDTTYLPRREFVLPSQFLANFRKNNYDVIINDKKSFNTDCISSLDGLLDEILHL